MKYLNLYNSHSEYQEPADLPNVSYCDQEDEIHYNPYIDPLLTTTTEVIGQLSIFVNKSRVDTIYIRKGDTVVAPYLPNIDLWDLSSEDAQEHIAFVQPNQNLDISYGRYRLDNYGYGPGGTTPAPPSSGPTSAPDPGSDQDPDTPIPSDPTVPPISTYPGMNNTESYNTLNELLENE